MKDVVVILKILSVQNLFFLNNVKHGILLEANMRVWAQNNSIKFGIVSFCQTACWILSYYYSIFEKHLDLGPSTDWQVFKSKS